MLIYEGSKVFKRTVLTVFDKGIESLQQTQIFNPLYFFKPEAEFKEPRLDAVQIRDIVQT